MQKLQAFLREEHGGSAAEYGLILGIVCIFLIAGIIALRNAIIVGINTTDNAFHSRGF